MTMKEEERGRENRFTLRKKRKTDTNNDRKGGSRERERQKKDRGTCRRTRGYVHEMATVICSRGNKFVQKAVTFAFVVLFL